MKVLIAIDRSDFGDAIAEFVSEHNWVPGSTFMIMHVVPFDTPDQYVIARDQQQEADQLLDRLGARLSKLGDFEIVKEIVLGNPKERISHTARKWDAQLIILGSHGRGRSTEYPLGSVSLAVVSQATCSVVVVHLPEAKSASHIVMNTGERLLSSKDAVPST